MYFVSLRERAPEGGACLTIRMPGADAADHEPEDDSAHEREVTA